MEKAQLARLVLQLYVVILFELIQGHVLCMYNTYKYPQPRPACTSEILAEALSKNKELQPLICLGGEQTDLHLQSLLISINVLPCQGTTSLTFYKFSF